MLFCLRGSIPLFLFLLFFRGGFFRTFRGLPLFLFLSRGRFFFVLLCCFLPFLQQGSEHYPRFSCVLAVCLATSYTIDQPAITTINDLFGFGVRVRVTLRLRFIIVNKTVLSCSFLAPNAWNQGLLRLSLGIGLGFSVQGHHLPPPSPSSPTTIAVRVRGLMFRRRY